MHVTDSTRGAISAVVAVFVVVQLARVSVISNSVVVVVVAAVLQWQHQKQLYHY